jgi:hypothetical protein
MQHAKQCEPLRLSADHHFLSDDENSSGSDEENARGRTGAMKQQHSPHAHSNGAVSQQPSAAAPAPGARHLAEQVQQPSAAASTALQVCFTLSLSQLSRVWGCLQYLSLVLPFCPLSNIAIGKHQIMDMLNLFLSACLGQISCPGMQE